MKMTLEQLKSMNTLCDCNSYDLEKINELITFIEKSRNNSPQPEIGDVVMYTNGYGRYYPRAIIDEIDESDICLCERGSAYVSTNSMSISGGAFQNVDIKDLIYKGKTKTTFWTFGRLGCTAGGGIYFEAEVNLWECNMNPSQFSTKNRDLFYVSHSSIENIMGYKWFVSTGTNSYRAWKSETELQAWLRTYRAVINKSSKDNISIWCYKTQEHHCTPAEFESENAEEDIFLMNGKRKCKRIYDDKNGIVHLYYVWYWGDMEGKNFYETMEIQNRAIREYEAENWSNRENQIAAMELKRGLVQPFDLTVLKDKK